MKKGLVLEGGAMRGMFTAGVLDVMMREKLVFDGLIGVSAGAVFPVVLSRGFWYHRLWYDTKERSIE